jgi:WD40 repeat protein
MPPFAPLELESHCIAALFVADVPCFALADGAIHRWQDGHQVTHAHEGLLAAVATPDRAALLTSGEDGRVCRTSPSGDLVELASVARKWITTLACGPAGAFAFGSGRTVWLHGAHGPVRELQHASGVEDLAFAPDGSRVAAARYDGASIHSLAGGGDPVELQWKGMQAGIMFSPDARFLMMAMKDNTLHGWRLQDARHFRMTGYPGKVRDWSWSTDGKWLATSGAPAAVLWPFEGQDGPIGNTPLELGAPGHGLVTALACHPVEGTVAIGYADGAIVSARIDADVQVELRPAGKGELTSLGWNAAGTRIAFGSEHGECGVIDVPA